ncbi:MAG: acyl carrier protein [Deltaproteobacteria bacterium]|nr:MAG: acyl carrier protein [Deltaproteobacteria bacterium]
MSEFAEPRIRRLVADYLGVSADELTPEVSLTDDLAADSLDLVELALALEGEFGIEVPERMIDEVRTYGDLVETAAALTRGLETREISPARARRRWSGRASFRPGSRPAPASGARTCTRRTPPRRSPTTRFEPGAERGSR